MDILMPFLNANDSSAVLSSVIFKSNSFVEKDQIIATFETTKASIDLESPGKGWISWNYTEGDIVVFGSIIGKLHNEKPVENFVELKNVNKSTNITRKAKELIEKHKVDISKLDDREIILEKDILELLNSSNDIVSNDEIYPVELKEFEDLLSKLLLNKRNFLKKNYDRHVPTGTLLNDRWDLAEYLGFGKKSSIYDESLVIGKVYVGENCWIGPFTILDGSGGELRIGDWTSIGTGTHVYTHHTINLTLTGGKSKIFHSKTEIGKNCFVSPNVIISPGTKIGNYCFIAANSFVEGVYPDFSYISGTPSKIIGKVVVDGAKVRFELFDQQ
jgi:acetyltransferase-like isoleucine patch superfamily enzyme